MKRYVQNWDRTEICFYLIQSTLDNSNLDGGNLLLELKRDSNYRKSRKLECRSFLALISSGLAYFRAGGTALKVERLKAEID